MKLRRPRLEIKKNSRMYAIVQTPEDEHYQAPILVVDSGKAIPINLKDAKRLHAFLGKAICYLESDSKKKRKVRK